MKDPKIPDSLLYSHEISLTFPLSPWKAIGIQCNSHGFPPHVLHAIMLFVHVQYLQKALDPGLVVDLESIPGTLFGKG